MMDIPADPRRVADLIIAAEEEERGSSQDAREHHRPAVLPDGLGLAITQVHRDAHGWGPSSLRRRIAGLPSGLRIWRAQFPARPDGR